MVFTIAKPSGMTAICVKGTAEVDVKLPLQTAAVEVANASGAVVRIWRVVGQRLVHCQPRLEAIAAPLRRREELQLSARLGHDGFDDGEAAPRTGVAGVARHSVGSARPRSRSDSAVRDP